MPSPLAILAEAGGTPLAGTGVLAGLVNMAMLAVAAKLFHTPALSTRTEGWAGPGRAGRGGVLPGRPVLSPRRGGSAGRTA